LSTHYIHHDIASTYITEYTYGNTRACYVTTSQHTPYVFLPSAPCAYVTRE